MADIYYEDLEVGQAFFSGFITAEHAPMLAYGIENDPWPYHVDEEAAAKTMFGGLIASGGYTITLHYRTLKEIYFERGDTWHVEVALDWRLKFAQAVRAGDELRQHYKVLEKKLTKSGVRGIITVQQNLENRQDDVVMASTVELLFARRPT
jgi:acyl dehydratase